MPPNTILILGAGPRVGGSVAQKFKAEGYKVAIGSRNPDIAAATNAGFLPITVDLTNIQSVEAAFALVTKSLGVPNVVVYNGEGFPIALRMTRFTKTYLFCSCKPYLP
jgi:NAD(P)-dependent dehydrogenase (short-subunit alcohol dehydrogenase family)